MHVIFFMLHNYDIDSLYQYVVSKIYEVTPFTQVLQVKCAEDPEYTTSVVVTM